MPYTRQATTHTPQVGIILKFDGIKEVLSKVYFMRARLMEDSTVLKLYYSFCDVEIRGENLGKIFDDFAISTVGGEISVDREPSVVRMSGEPIIRKITCIHRE